MNNSSTRFNGSLASPPPWYKQWRLAGNRALFFDQLIKEFGDFIHYRGILDFYLVNHPELVKQVLKGTHKSFDKNTVIYRRFGRVFGAGLVSAEGEQWRRQRVLMQPMFSPKAVQRFFDAMVSATEEKIEKFRRFEATKRSFDISPEMHELTLSIAGKALFSDGFDSSAEKITRWAKTINEYVAKPPIPILRASWFPSATNLRLRSALIDFKTFIAGLISERREGEERDDLLEILLNARHEDSGEPIPLDQLIDEVLGMIIGGHETSASLLTWLWYELDRHPEVAAEMRSELLRVVGDGRLTHEHLSELRYTKMVIDETLRLHPPFWFENRNAMDDTELGGVRLPKGSLVALSRYSLHRHPSFWKDPETFNPNRHDPVSPENERNSFAFIPYSGGPRTCIGMHFANMELLIVATLIAREFDVRVHSSDRHEMIANLTIAPRYGVRVTLQRPAA